MNKLTAIEAISLETTILEARREHGEELSVKEMEYLNVLNFCYDLLSRTQLSKELVIPTPEELKDCLGHDTEMTQIYGIIYSRTLDQIFKIAIKSPGISLREILNGLILGSKIKVCEKSGVYPANLSNYLSEKTEIQTDTFERLINAALCD